MRLVFTYDFASPFAYLAATQVEALAARTGSELRWRPVLLGGLFRDLGGVDVPLFTMPPAKRALIEADLERWAAWWGVPLRWPDAFPLRSVLALRVTLAHPDPLPFVRRVFHAAWGEGRDIGDPAVLRACGADDALLEAAPTQRERLRHLTDEARGDGVFGVPTFQIEGCGTFWGQDRLPMVEAVLRGWEPPQARGG
jgi:2-hydroxychromene-2-carboxylate isomerase